MDERQAMYTAELWRAGKMIGGDEDEVRDALLAALEARIAQVKELQALVDARPDPDEVLRLFSEYRSMMAKAVFEATQGNDITAGSLEIAADDAASELVKLLKGGE